MESVTHRLRFTASFILHCHVSSCSQTATVPGLSPDEKTIATTRSCN